VSKLRTALVVGGGIAGTTLASELQSQGVSVTVVDSEPEPTFRGIGIALLPAALRSLQSLGLLDECIERGYPQYVFRTCAPDGAVLATTPLKGLLGPDYPPCVGLPRSTFGEILRASAVETGVDLRFGLTVSGLENEPEGVYVAFSDGSTGTYDMVVGADGMRSTVRSLVFPNEPAPNYLGQCAWRILAGERPDEIDSQFIFLGEHTRAGFNPILPDDVYIYLLHQTDNSRPTLTAEDSLALFQELFGEYGGIAADVAARLTPENQSHYGPLFTTFVEHQWYRGRVMLIGDAAHATPPHLASGAGIALEDAIVLARCVREYDEIDEAFAAFMDRRYTRCKMVIDNSRQLSRWDLDPRVDRRRVAALTTDTWEALSATI